MSTVLVTMMPFFAERVGLPRTAGLEFPFGHTLGHPGDRDEQTAVIRDALSLLRDATQPGTIVHLPYEWPDFDSWRRAWHPEKPAPIIRWLREQAKAREAGSSEGG